MKYLQNKPEHDVPVIPESHRQISDRASMRLNEYASEMRRSYYDIDQHVRSMLPEVKQTDLDSLRGKVNDLLGSIASAQGEINHLHRLAYSWKKILGTPIPEEPDSAEEVLEPGMTEAEASSQDVRARCLQNILTNGPLS